MHAGLVDLQRRGGMSATPSINDFDKLKHEIEERKKKMKREMEDLDRNLDLVKKLKANQENANQLYESGLRELEKTMLKVKAEAADSDLTDSNKGTVLLY